ncbi:MAG: amidase [Acidilobus sp.]
MTGVWAVSVSEALRRIGGQGDVNAFVTVSWDSEREAASIERAGLTPRPIGVKDVIMTRNLRTTMASRLFKDYIPSRDALVVKRLKAAGFVVVGKTNTHEFASGATTTSSIFGPTRNPHDHERIAGGSSGGSAAAVAAGMLDAALGTDTAGSVRIPASLCGVYGIRPSPGLIPKSGVFPLSPTFDEVGVIANSLDVLEDVMRAVARVWRPGERAHRPRLGVPRGLYSASPDVERALWNIVTRFDYELFDLPLARRVGQWAFSVIRLSEASAVHLRYRDRWGEYFPDVRRLMERGLQFTATEYVSARKAMSAVRREALRALRRVDVIVTPTTPVPAPRIDEVVGREDGEVRSLLTSNTWLSPLAGLPSISLPLIRSQGLPVGLQLVGRDGADPELLSMARLVEEEAGK